ncbi:hypothetical protein PSI22_14430 [Xenorhabdus sp. XENO-7]|uniref:SMI1/KNR4 family protein n=1 Tax=Xenorhabdus aichiensis TaxID=3025874 RepID=A0ABT5M535_9GAMM|nr:hypothetical protein [Xenorhabdus aichiensis]MDC9622801.1 hypothetical protein [Xenorhabdus aichiensis]
MINQELINYLHSAYPELTIDTSYIKGYSEDEIPKLERLYDIKIKGQLYDFLIYMGRCSGGLFGDSPLNFYQEQDTVRGEVIFQSCQRQELAKIQRHDLMAQKPFFISIESYTQFYFLLTKSDNPDLVYCFDENEEVVEDTGLTFNEYLRSVVDYDTRNAACKIPFDRSGDLLIL